jgi:periplasmic divalent cation tolerance protein
VSATESPNDVLVVFCTFPNPEKAAEVARTIVDERRAACVNLLPAVRSIYSWQGEVCDDAEALAVIKTSAGRFEALRSRIVELHPYDCPEVIAMPVCAGHADYLKWVVDSTPGE